AGVGRLAARTAARAPASESVGSRRLHGGHPLRSPPLVRRMALEHDAALKRPFRLCRAWNDFYLAPIRLSRESRGQYPECRVLRFPLILSPKLAPVRSVAQLRAG